MLSADDFAVVFEGLRFRQSQTQMPPVLGRQSGLGEKPLQGWKDQRQGALPGQSAVPQAPQFRLVGGIGGITHQFTFFLEAFNVGTTGIDEKISMQGQAKGSVSATLPGFVPLFANGKKDGPVDDERTGSLFIGRGKDRGAMSLRLVWSFLDFNVLIADIGFGPER